MNLDDSTAFAAIDPQDMLGQIEGLPGQLEGAWELGMRQALPDWKGLRQVVVAGMGGSAIGADLLASYAAPVCPAPLFVLRGYELPAWASGPETLVIASSHSGNTEETLWAYGQANERGCRCLAVTTGGRLAQVARDASAPVWLFEHGGQPRAAVGFSFGLLLAAFVRLGLLPDQAQALARAVEAMRRQQAGLGPDMPAVHNRGKRFAGQLVGRYVSVFGADFMEPVARRWKTQINEIAKAWAQFEFIPEANHNTLAGVLNPEEQLSRIIVIFLRASQNHPRNQRRLELTRRTFMLEGLNTDPVDAQGDSPLEQLWTALHLGDYIAYYLAMAYGVDPTPVDALTVLKNEMRQGEDASYIKRSEASPGPSTRQKPPRRPHPTGSGRPSPRAPG